MAKKKSLPFKKGMEVVYIHDSNGRISLQEGEVTVVTTRDGETVVHIRTPDRWGGYYKRSFSPVAGMFQENPYPIWKLMPLNGHSAKNLKKRADKATVLYQKYQESYREIQNQVEYESKEWMYAEVARRTADLPHGGTFLSTVIARMGFKKPKDGVKVKVNGSILTVK